MYVRSGTQFLQHKLRIGRSQGANFRALLRRIIRNLSRMLLTCLFVLSTSLNISHAQQSDTALTETPAIASSQPSSTLERIRERGFLVCGTAGILSGFASRNADGAWVGFDVDICRALATAVLGNPDLVEFRAMNGEARFVQLETGEVDIMVRNGPWTMGRDVQFGARYVTPTFFDGLTFLTRNDTGMVSAYMLDELSVCVSLAGDDLQHVRDFFFANQAAMQEIVYEDRTDLILAYRAGICDVIAAPASQLQAFRRSLPDPGQHRIMPELISKAIIAPAVRKGEPQWEDIVRFTIFALINAEELGITSVNLQSLASSKTPAVQRFLSDSEDTFSNLAPDWRAQVIGAVGNYREIYERHFGAQTGGDLKRGLNSIWTQGGMLYAPMQY